MAGSQTGKPDADDWQRELERLQQALADSRRSGRTPDRSQGGPGRAA